MGHNLHALPSAGAVDIQYRISGRREERKEFGTAMTPGFSGALGNE